MFTQRSVRRFDLRIGDQQAQASTLFSLDVLTQHFLRKTLVLDEFKLSRRTLDNRMKRATGQSVYTAICRMRVDLAKQMLVKTDASMQRVSRECGFDRQSRFNEVFKRMTGLTPGQFRQQRSR